MGCLDLMFYHTKVEVSNDLENFQKHVKSFGGQSNEVGWSERLTYALNAM